VSGISRYVNPVAYIVAVAKFEAAIFDGVQPTLSSR